MASPKTIGKWANHNANKTSNVDPFGNKNLIEDNETPTILACDDLICFLLGGTQFQILKSKFAYWPHTRLPQLIRAKTREEILRLCDDFVLCKKTGQPKRYIFYRNGQNFNSILDKFYFGMKPVNSEYFPDNALICLMIFFICFLNIGYDFVKL